MAAAAGERSAAGLQAKFCEESDRFSHAVFRTFADSNYKKLYSKYASYKSESKPLSREKMLRDSLQGLQFEFKPLALQDHDDCPARHGLQPYVRPVALRGSHLCDGGCGRDGIRAPEQIYRCDECDFDVCRSCFQEPRKCPESHVLQAYVRPADGTNICDGCEYRIRPPEQLFRCAACDFDMCQACYKLSDHPEVNAVHVYTDDGVFPKITSAVLMDDPDVLDKLMPTCRALNKYIVEHPAPRDATLWHGSKIRRGQIAEIGPAHEPNRGTFRIPKYMSISESEDKAGQFAARGAPILEFVIKKGCLNATPVMHHSKYRQEMEWVMPPYTPVRWLQQGWRTFAGELRLVVTFEVLDGKCVDETVPSCLIMVQRSPDIHSSGITPPLSKVPAAPPSAPAAAAALAALAAPPGAHAAAPSLFAAASCGVAAASSLFAAPSLLAAAVAVSQRHAVGDVAAAGAAAESFRLDDDIVMVAGDADADGPPGASSMPALPMVLQDLVVNLPDGCFKNPLSDRQKLLQDGLLAPLSALFLARGPPTAESKDVLLGLLEDLYYSLKKLRYAHAGAETITAAIAALHQRQL